MLACSQRPHEPAKHHCGRVQEAPQAVEEGKVAAVSRAVSDALVAIDAAAYLRPLVTARTTLGDIHGALQLIKDAKEAQLARDEAPQVNGTGEPGAAARGTLVAWPAAYVQIYAVMCCTKNMAY